MNISFGPYKSNFFQFLLGNNNCESMHENQSKGYPPINKERVYQSIDQIENAQRRLQREYLQYLQPIYPYPQSSNPRIFPFYLEQYNNYDNKFANIGKHALNNYIPFKGTTSYQEHYQNHSLQSKSLNPQLYSLVIPKVPFYPRYQIKFQGQSTYKADYTNNEVMDSIRHLNSEKINRKSHWSESRSPFYGQSSYKEEFKPFKVQASRVSYPTANESEPKKVRFDDSTSYKDEFKGFKVQLPRQQRCDVDYLPVPFKNNINSSNHIYYDSQQNKFV